MRPSPRLLSLFAALLSVGLAVGASWGDSATTDEPYHLLAGWSYVVEGKGDLNPEHPPLPKLLAGVALMPLGLRGTVLPPVERLGLLPLEARRFLYANLVDAQKLLRVARSSQLVWLVLLLWAVHAGARDLAGEGAAALAVAAVGLQPLVLGHSLLVHTDVAAAATFTATLVWLRRWLRGSPRAWIGFGLFLGASLLCKFTALLLLVAVAFLLAVDLVRRPDRGRLARGLLGLALGFAVLFAGYHPVVRRTTAQEREATIAAYASRWPAAAGPASFLTRLSAASPEVAQLGLGLLFVRETNREGQGVVSFLGRTSRHGSPLYFPVAFLVKLSAPFLLLLLLAAFRGRPLADADDAVFLFPAFLLAAASVASTYNIGARHLLPLLPVLAVWASRRAVRFRPLVPAIVGAGLVASALVSFPHYISHFGLQAGGASRGERYLNDSNLDWGQDWARLGREAKGKGWSPLSTVQVGTAFPGYWLPGSRDYLVEGLVPAPGYYAVSSFARAVGPGYLERLGQPDEAARLRALLERLRTEGAVVGGVGTSLSVYRLPGNGPL